MVTLAQPNRMQAGAAAMVPKVANGMPKGTGLKLQTGPATTSPMEGRTKMGGRPEHQQGQGGTPMQQYLRSGQRGPGPGPGQVSGGPGQPMGNQNQPAAEQSREATRAAPQPNRYQDPGPVQREAGPAVEGVSGHLDKLLSSESPYIRQARERASRAANARGLQSSSIAAGAGEEAAIAAGLPIAQGDADIMSRERTLRSQEFQQARQQRVEQLMQQRGLDHTSAEKQADRELQTQMQERGIESSEFMQERDHRVQQLMQQEGLSHDEAQRQADRELSDAMQQRDLRVRQLMQQEGLTHDAAQRQADRELSDTMQQRSITSTEGMQKRDIASREMMQDKSITSAQFMQGRELRTRELMQERGLTHEAAQRQADRELSDLMQTRQIDSDQLISQRDRDARVSIANTQASTQRAIADANRKAQERIATTQAVTDVNSEFLRWTTAITSNPDIPAETRDAAQEQIASIRDESMSAISEISEYKPKWTSARASVADYVGEGG